ncbi:hypothetical protein K474DRAFT_1706361 [Panus rudis PR-1116 ss-1]|nr:hypothetical protein K474DRAFT_1706361 [Panus rudis PR-1116 ss-1]
MITPNFHNITAVNPGPSSSVDAQRGPSPSIYLQIDTRLFFYAMFFCVGVGIWAGLAWCRYMARRMSDLVEESSRDGRGPLIEDFKCADPFIVQEIFGLNPGDVAQLAASEEKRLVSPLAVVLSEKSIL